MKKRSLCLSGLIIIFGGCSINHALIDRSAKRLGDGLTWNGVHYQSADYYTTPLSKSFLAEDQDGASVNGYGDDPEHTYLEVSSFLDNYLFVRDDYQIKNHGEVTAIAVRGQQIQITPERIRIKSILEQSLMNHQRCTFITNNDLAKIEYSYNKSCVTDNPLGYISYSEQNWFYINSLSTIQFKQLYHGKKITLDCYKINPEYTRLFNEIKSVYNWFNDPNHPRSIQIEPI